MPLLNDLESQSATYEKGDLQFSIVDQGPVNHPRLVIAKADKSPLTKADSLVIEHVEQLFKADDSRSRFDRLEASLKDIDTKHTKYINILITGASIVSSGDQVISLKAALEKIGATEVPFVPPPSSLLR